MNKPATSTFALPTALLLAPLAALHAQSLPVLPGLTITGNTFNYNAGDGLTYLHYFYLRRTDAPQLTYTVEVSSELSSWQIGTGFTQEIGATPTGDGVTQLVTVRRDDQLTHLNHATPLFPTRRHAARTAGRNVPCD